MKFVQVALILLVAFVVGCAVNPPVQEYALARTALEAAKVAGAEKYSPSIWFKAEEAYRVGEAQFSKGKFEEARQHFADTLDLSERAENKARYDKRKSGELP